MANFRVWIETTRKGSFQVRYQTPDGARHASGYCIEKHESALVDGRQLTGKMLANALAKRLEDRYYKKELGCVDSKEGLTELLEVHLNEDRLNNHSIFSINHKRNSLEPFLRENHLSRLSDLSHSVIQDWKESMMRGQLAESTIRGRLGDVRTFLNWLRDSGRIHENYFGKKMMPKKKDAEPRYYSSEEFKALDDAMGTVSHEGRIAINLAHDAGLRKIEMVGDGQERGGALWEDLTWLEDGSAELHLRREVVKGSARPRTVPLSPGVLKLLGSRRTGPLVPLTRCQLDHYFATARKLAGINPELDIHGLRHTFAKNHLQKGGGTTASLQKLLGHASLQSTQIYAQFEKSYFQATVALAYERRKQEEALIPSRLGTI